ncbi:hypothetical protein BUY19_01835 [Staphylococcus cohnii]|nr:hypothetical protein BUY19_01835 [Staphylococcus cohnii]
MIQFIGVLLNLFLYFILLARFLRRSFSLSCFLKRLAKIQRIHMSFHIKILKNKVLYQPK